VQNASKYSLAIPLLIFLSGTALAQRVPTGGPPADRRNADRVRQQEMSNREWQLRNFGNESNAPKDRRQIEALLAQTEEDFNRILTINNEFARLLTGSKPIEYNFISEASAEIKKRASRLQSTLNLHQLPTDKPVVEKADDLDDTQFKDALIRMCKQIRSFVTNPVIANPNTVDAQQLTNARRDLESLIQLSGHIKKEAGKKHNTTALNTN
jgi:malonyl CoA-acyl carrier protein transacylase